MHQTHRRRVVIGDRHSRRRLAADRVTRAGAQRQNDRLIRLINTVIRDHDSERGAAGVRSDPHRARQRREITGRSRRTARDRVRNIDIRRGRRRRVHRHRHAASSRRLTGAVGRGCELHHRHVIISHSHRSRTPRTADRVTRAGPHRRRNGTVGFIGRVVCSGDTQHSRRVARRDSDRLIPLTIRRHEITAISRVSDSHRHIQIRRRRRRRRHREHRGRALSHRRAGRDRYLRNGRRRLDWAGGLRDLEITRHRDQRLHRQRRAVRHAASSRTPARLA